MEECNSCGNEYKNVTLHWVKSDCEKPDLSDYQKELITGIVMGDGSVANPNTADNPTLRVKMINEEFLSWLDSELGWLSNGYTLTQTAEEAAEENRRSGFSPNARAENYHDKYTLRTKGIDELNRWRDWYGENGKVFPEDINPTETVMKMWYVCDGALEKYNKTPHISISANNERNNEDKIKSLFTEIGVSPVVNESTRSWSIRLSQEDSKKFFDYIGDPPDGFRRKWPDYYFE